MPDDLDNDLNNMDIPVQANYTGNDTGNAGEIKTEVEDDFLADANVDFLNDFEDQVEATDTGNDTGNNTGNNTGNDTGTILKRAKWVDPTSENPCIFTEFVKEKNFLEFAKTFKREFKAKKVKIDLSDRNCMAKMYLIGVNTIAELTTDLLRTFNQYNSSNKNVQQVTNYVDDIFDITIDYYDKKSDKIGDMLKSFENVQWAYYRRPSDPRLKHVFKQWRRLNAFFQKSLLILDDVNRSRAQDNPIKSVDIVTQLIPNNAIQKHREFLFDSREKFLYKSKRNGVVKYAVILNSSLCKEDGCNNYSVIGAPTCFVHLLERNIKIKPSHIRPGKLGLFAWLPPNERTIGKITEPVFFGPPNTNTDYNAAGPLKERSYGYNFDTEFQQQKINPEETPASRFTAMDTKSILDFEPLPSLDEAFPNEIEESNEYISLRKKQFYFGTPLVYIHPQTPGIILEDNINGEFSPRMFFESEKRSFAYVTVRKMGESFKILPLEDIYHGQELVFLPTSKFLLNKEQVKQTQVIHRTVKKNDFSLPMTPIQIKRRIEKMLELYPNLPPTTVIDIGNLKKITFKKRKFIQLNNTLSPDLNALFNT